MTGLSHRGAMDTIRSVVSFLDDIDMDRSRFVVSKPQPLSLTLGNLSNLQKHERFNVSTTISLMK
jgi:hypothetical protein